MEEIWKPVKGYEGYYEVSSFGNVRSINRVITHGSYNHNLSGKILRQQLRKYNYLQVILSKDNQAKTFLVHRLVALAFLINTEDKPQINHKDGNPKNNRLQNLEWATSADNIRHSYDVLKRKGTAFGKKGGQHNCAKKVRQLSLNGDLIKVWGSVIEAQNSLDIKSIYHCCLGNYRTAGGYHWEYV